MTEIEYEDDLDIVAYHEAGHAIMAMACGFTLTELSIVPDEVRRGFVGYNPGAPLDGEVAHKAALVSASGLAADMLLAQKTGKPRPDGLFLGHFNDQENANRYIALSGDQGTFNDYMVLSMWFLKSNWEYVDLFAGLLKAFPTMNAGSINADAYPRLPDDWERRLELIKANP